MSRQDLHEAKKTKNDEFYTQREDIELELKHYKSQFRDKVVFCNCDDPYESNFFRYFVMNFKHLGLKRLITTSYKPSPIDETQLTLSGIFDDLEELKPKKGRPKAEAKRFIINDVGDIDGDGAYTLKDIAEQLKANKNNEWTTIKGDKDYPAGDFRSKECVELLKQADIVVTNPPFSLFREFLSLITENNKEFLIIGNTNALTYKEVFQLFQADNIRTGYTNFNVGMFFEVPGHWEKYHHINEEGIKIARVSTACWFTNMEVSRHKEKLTLYKKYDPEYYPKYDNYDAINVNKYTDIPIDYNGAIGVPITFLDKYNPDQFELIALGNSRENFTPNKQYVNAKKILKDGSVKNGNAVNSVLTIAQPERPIGMIHYISSNSEYLIAPYARILIKRKESS